MSLITPNLKAFANLGLSVAGQNVIFHTRNKLYHRIALWGYFLYLWMKTNENLLGDIWNVC